MKPLYKKTITFLGLLFVLTPFVNAADFCTNERQVLAACKRQYSNCPANTRALETCLASHGGGGSTSNCADEERAITNCKAKYPGSSCPQTTAKWQACVGTNGGSDLGQVGNGGGNGNGGQCSAEQNAVAACKVQHPGSSCPRTTAKLETCLGGGVNVANVTPGQPTTPGGKCPAEQQQLAACKVQYPSSSCPRTTEKLNVCLNGGSPSEDQGGPSGSTKCNNPSKQTDMQCMICNCFHEANGESAAGKLAVGKVVVTRRYTDRFPKTICGVIYQESQFSWTASSRKKNMTISGPSYRNCRKASEDALKTNGNYAVHYHADYVTPKWAKGCPKLETIGNHIFYRDCDVWQATHRNSGTAQ